MADLSYNAFLNSKQDSGTSNNKLSYNTFLAQKQEKVATQAKRADLISKGLPVSANPNKADPSLVGSIIRAPLKLGADVLTNIARAGQVVIGQEPTADLSNKYLGKVEGLGELDVTKGLTPQNVKTLKKSAGTGAEIASYLVGGEGATTAVGKGLAKTAAKKTFSELVASTAPRLMAEGAAMGLTGSVGSQLRNNADYGTPMSVKQTLQDTAIGAILNPVASLGISKVGKVLTGGDEKIIAARKALRDTSNAEILGRPIPPVTGPLDTIKAKAKVTDTLPFNPKEVSPTPNINIEQGARWNTPVVKPSNPYELRATKATSKQDFINSEVGFLTKTKQLPTSSIMKKIDTAWEKMHPAPVQETIPKVSTKKVPTTEVQTTQPVTHSGLPTDTPTVNAPVTPKYTPDTIPQEVITKTMDSMKLNNPTETFVSGEGKYKQWIIDAHNNPITTTQIALGNMPAPEGIPLNLYSSIAKNMADESGNYQLARELANVTPARTTLSKGASEMRAAQLTAKDNSADIIYKLENDRYDQLHPSVKEKIKQEDAQAVIKAFNEIEQLSKDGSIISQVIDTLMCK